MGLAQALDALIAAGKPVQIHLRHQLQPIGPGKITRYTQPYIKTWYALEADAAYPDSEAMHRIRGEFSTKELADAFAVEFHRVHHHEIPPRSVSVVEREPPNMPTLYRMLAPAMMQATPQSRPQKMFMPIIFDVAELQMIIEDPINAEGDKAILTPPSNGGGLIIPGRAG